ncbi:DNA topoisomerase (ATP-hydrolyzing) subunit A [filamentous cyanobacterium LEGE 11480]|uniref:DNA gyrase subunit A n=1 Tax=Romeriopsis navalis LEGE 11480 TaxID=2777977 RepID=A0A928VNU4_9CYAN|nr:DNA topoisomerase (ATP-hydrolyzing) subunit A [Romeriopsis navalis]MBE9029399.1 DNA topoisomerase (ATP-hydrolyzing) subunit A [Romeriopsis navalis LEGE 11480]
MTYSQEPPNEERIIPTDLRNEMQRSYLEYAMSVIVGRALPDARDGLKPVHRRILYAMHELGLTHDRPFRKCARVVGEVLGKYHPHGDTAVYDALVRMAQDFSMRVPLIDGHGNFGSIDNDPPAAMRYTESRLTPLTGASLLADIEMETVDFADNFDGSQQEPVVMPSRIPQLLVNGSAGIAVGMATNIPPHNLGEVIDGLIAMIENPEITDLELMQYIPGPDFPTGALIIGKGGNRDTYTTGRGSVTMRGVANIETIEAPGRPDRDAIIVTELPYQTNKAALIEKIADLVNDKKIDGIADIRDESDRDGMRIVIEMKRDAYARVVLNNLYKQTPIQTNFGANMLALVNNEPQLLTLSGFLKTFLDFRIEAITRRTQFLLRKAEARDHLLMGLLTALANLDAIIALIRGSADVSIAKDELIETYGLSAVQADAILQMQLRRLTALEAEKIEREHQELLAQITDYRDILDRRERILEIIVNEVTAIKEAHSTPRRTRIEMGDNELMDEDLIANEKSVILITEQGYVKRMPVDTFGAQSRNTRGKAGAKMKDDDAVDHFLTVHDHDVVMVFSDRGVVYALKAYQIPTCSRTARGTPMVQLINVGNDEKITSVIGVSEFNEEVYLVMLTQRGFIKKTSLAKFSNIRSNGIIAISLEDEDLLRWVSLATANDSIIIGSSQGRSIHFRVDNEQLRPLGRATRGVRSMNLREGDSLIGMAIISSQILADQAALMDADSDDDSDEEVNDSKKQGPWMLVVTSGGYGKRVPVNMFRLQKRGGMGIIATKFRKKKDTLVGLTMVTDGEELMIVTNRSIIIRQLTDAISIQSRPASGVRLQRLDDENEIVAIAVVPLADGEEDLDDDLEVLDADGNPVATDDDAVDVESEAVEEE